MAPDVLGRYWKMSKIKGERTQFAITAYVKGCAFSFPSEKSNLGVYSAFSWRNIY